MKILIVGATSFLGSNFIRVIKECNPDTIVNTVARDELIFIEDIISSFKPEILINFAASFNKVNLDENLNCNIVLPVKMMSSGSENGCKAFFQIGSYWELGDKSAPDIPIDEYSASKSSVYQFIKFFNKYRNISAAEVIIYGTYGYNDNRGKILDKLIYSCLIEEKLLLTDGYQRLNLLNVEQIAETLLSIINLIFCGKLSLDRFAVYSEKDYSVREIVKIINKYKNIDADFGRVEYRKTELMTPIYPSWKEGVFVLNDELETYIKSKLKNYKGQQ